MPEGRRKAGLAQALENRLSALFGPRLLSFDARAADAYAQIRVRAGKAIAASDRYIAAIAAALGLMVATRDAEPFQAAGLQVINPWGADDASREAPDRQSDDFLAGELER